jgi:hypothetical protein
MTATVLVASVGVVSATMFTAWALYIMLVEHPARLAVGPAAGRVQFRESYKRVAPWQGSFAAIALVCGAVVAALTGRGIWLAGALAVGAAIPLTVIVIRPTNKRLLSGELLDDDEVRRLLGRWGQLHAVRTALGAIGVLLFLSGLRLR